MVTSFIIRGGNGITGGSIANNFEFFTVFAWKIDAEANKATIAREVKSFFIRINFLNYLSYK
ncbi:MAG: hypothetical protein WCJ01_12110, partial [Ignavibacteria bacterium]